ncbi:OsmC family protein [Aquincola sp. S2]|uniref:OsmC family protein n=1 Tax=Pseudaquabacterium terrae TaxID=2732868 RepID=A0ABX2EG65_9BURK|nr:OsmC family protein [Aquabacterium terrae]NRF67588.1 OsmC family protein [Aquabacterium terrae]
MPLTVTRDLPHPMKHTVHVRQHAFAVDEPPANGGEDLGLTPHDTYDAALGACKAMTVVWYARRKQIPLQDVRVSVERDDSEERQGTYRLLVTLELGGALTDAQRRELLAVAEKCPLHKLMTQVKSEISTTLAPPAA